jgi:hypothetical protein
MIFRKSRKTPLAVAPGLVFLAIANIGSYVMRRSGQYPESMVDGVSGLLFGIAIGLLLLGIAFGSRERCCGRSSTPADE